jgi:hypothetical protein
LTGRPAIKSPAYENLAGLSIVGPRCASRRTLPVFNVMLATDTTTNWVATQFEIGINCWVGASYRRRQSPFGRLSWAVINSAAERIMKLDESTKRTALRRFGPTSKALMPGVPHRPHGLNHDVSLDWNVILKGYIDQASLPLHDEAAFD